MYCMAFLNVCKHGSAYFIINELNIDKCFIQQRNLGVKLGCRTKPLLALGQNPFGTNPPRTKLPRTTP